jgi:hypothetical protein
MSRAYRDGLNDLPYFGGGSLADYNRGKQNAGYNKPGGGSGFGGIILFGVAVALLVFTLPIIIAASFAAIFSALLFIVCSGFFINNQPIPKFGQVYKSTVFTSFFYIAISATVAGVLALIDYTNPGYIFELVVLTNEWSVLSITLVALSVFLLPSILITPFIFKKWLRKSSSVTVNYFKSMLYLLAFTAIWLMFIALTYPLLSYFFPDIIDEWKKLNLF